MYGYWLFVAGTVTAAVGVALVAASVGTDRVGLRQAAYLAAGLGLTGSFAGLVVARSLHRSAKALVVLGAVVCLAAAVWFLAVFPADWGLDSGRTRGVVLSYAVGMGPITVSGAVAPVSVGQSRERRAVEDELAEARENEARIEELEAALDEREERIEELESTVEELESRLDEREERIEELTEHEDRVEELETELADREDRVESREERAGELETTVEELEFRLGEREERIETLEAFLERYGGLLERVGAGVNSARERVETAQRAVGSRRGADEDEPEPESVRGELAAAAARVEELEVGADGDGSEADDDEDGSAPADDERAERAGDRRGVIDARPVPTPARPPFGAPLRVDGTVSPGQSSNSRSFRCTREYTFGCRFIPSSTRS